MEILPTPSSCLSRWLWPLFVVAVAGSATTAISTDHMFVATAVLPVFVLVVLAVLELVRPADRARTWQADPQIGCDIGHAIVGGWVAERIGVAVVMAAAPLAAATLPAVVSWWPSAWPLWMQGGLALFVAEGLEYLRHRWMHASERFWCLHRLHHDVDRMHVLKGSRIHFVDLFSRFAVVFAPLALVGAPAWLLPLYSVGLYVFGPISHANLDCRVPAWVHRFVVTPQVHAIHHARCEDLAGKNLAPILPLFDILGGTFEMPNPDRELRFGIQETGSPQTFLAQLVRPLEEIVGIRRARSHR